MKLSDHFLNEEIELFFEDMEKFLSNSEKKLSVPEIGKEIAKRILMNSFRSSKEKQIALSKILPKKQKVKIFRVDPTDKKSFAELKKKELQEAGKDIKKIPKENLEVVFTPQFLVQGGDEIIRNKKQDFLRELKNFLNYLIGNPKMTSDSKYGLSGDDPKIISLRQKLLSRFNLKPGQLLVDKVNYFNKGFSLALRVK